MHELPKLPYELNALEPHIDAATMEIHHSKHHQAYIDKLNGAIEGTEFESMELCDVIKNLHKVPENIRAVVRNNGGGHMNHSMFWESLQGAGMQEPQGTLADDMDQAFDSFDNFKKEFEAAGVGRFGSGWVWLVNDNGALKIVSTPNQDNPLIDNLGTPLLGVDVWEHAYYLKYQNKRPDYLKAMWNVINWEKVAEWHAKSNS